MPAAEHRHVVVAGNIGVGKSTLVAALAERRAWTPVYELEAAHPYLDGYYADPQRWGFHLPNWGSLSAPRSWGAYCSRSARRAVPG
jgi:deoxyadenosine/deoxycytidine kinase